MYIKEKGEKNMLAKYWKKIGMLILIVACVFNVMSKLVNKLSLNSEMLSSAQYVYDQQQEENEKENKVNWKSKIYLEKVTSNYWLNAI